MRQTATLFEQTYRTVDAQTDGQGQIRIPSILLQPSAASEVAEVVVEVALAPPLDDVTEVGGPEIMPLADLVQGVLAANEDAREVCRDAGALYYGMPFGREQLVPRLHPKLTSTSFADWLREFASGS